MATVGALSNDAENKIVEHLVKRTAWSQPSSLQVGLVRSNPSESATGTEITDDTGYSRVVTDGTYWTSPVTDGPPRTVSNSMKLMWGPFDLSHSLDGIVVWKDGTDYLLYWEHPSSVTVQIGETWAVNIGDLEFKIQTEAEEPSDTDDTLSNWCANALLDHMFMHVNWSPTNVYVGLSMHQQAAFTESTSGLTANEPTLGGYARQLTEGSQWNAANGGQLENVDWVEFGPFEGRTETIYSVFLADSFTGGNIIAYGNLGTGGDQSYEIGSLLGNEGVRFAPGGLRFGIEKFH